jgi:hypothetical protein|nr:MAG TPA: Minor capsid protein [Caudoviricetes sp.]
MGVKVFIEMDGVRRKLGKKNMMAGQRALVYQAHADMDQFVPKKSGSLRTASAPTSDYESIKYFMPYAKPQFYGMVKGGRVYKYSTPGTSRRWDLRGKARYMDQWRRAFVKGANL